MAFIQLMDVDLFTSQEYALYWAVKTNDSLSVETILDDNVDINFTDRLGDTPLHVALSSNFYTVASLLLLKNPDVNAIGKFGFTPLILAAKGGYFDIVEQLVSRGANVRHTDRDGCTALPWNSIGIQDRKIAHTLLLHGAYVDAQDCKGQTALHLALESYARVEDDNTELITNLLDWGASVFIKNKKGRHPLRLAGKLIRRKTIIHPLCLAYKAAQTRKIFGNHMCKLSCLGFFDTSNALTQKGVSMCKCLSHGLLCLSEIDKMKTFRLRVYKLFSKRSDPAFLEDREVRSSLKSFLQSTSVIDEFPIYSSFIRVMFIKREQRLTLLNKAQNLHLFCMNTSFPKEIIRMILSFLDDEDLRSVITADQEQS